MLLLSTLNRSVCGLAIAAAALSFTLAAPVFAAGTVYTWETEDGTTSFTDDPKRIPAKYKNVAKSRQMRRLADYPRLTPGPQHDDPGYYARLEQRLDSLRSREEPAPAPAMAAAAAATGPQQMLRIQQGQSIETAVDLGAMGSEPIVTENLRVYSKRSNQTTHITVTRQGDRVLSVVRPNDMPMEIGLDEKAITGMSPRRY